MTSGIRNNWVQALQKCVDTHGSPPNTTDSSTPINPRRHTTHITDVLASPVTAAESVSPSTRRRRRLTTDAVSSGVDAEDERRDRRRTTLALMSEPASEDRPQERSVEEEQELDNIERNIRRIHRRSITEFVQKHTPQHFDKFESGTAFTDGESDKREVSSSSERSTPISSAVSSPQEDYTSRRRQRSLVAKPLLRRMDLDRVKSVGHPRSPSARVKDRTRAKSPRTKSPPLDISGTDMVDSPAHSRSDSDHSILEDSLLGVIEVPSRRRDVIEHKWKEVEIVHKPSHSPILLLLGEFCKF